MERNWCWGWRFSVINWDDAGQTTDDWFQDDYQSCLLSTWGPLPSPIKALAHWLLVGGSWPLDRTPPSPRLCYVLSRFSHVPLFVTYWTVAHQAPVSMGFSRQEYWGGLPFPSQEIFLPQGLNLCLMSPAFSSRFFNNSTTWEAPQIASLQKKANFPFYQPCLLIGFSMASSRASTFSSNSKVIFCLCTHPY